MKNWQIISGLTSYNHAMSLMDKHVHDMIHNTAQEKILLLEHEDIYTAGTSASYSDLLNPQNIPVIDTGRGGKFTYHGPGQRIIYPMLNLASHTRTKDLKKYIFDLERWIIATLQEIDIDAFIVEDRVGIWVFDRGLEKKIASIGVRVKKWITYHGIAINIHTNLKRFDGIIPCGLANYGVTSLQSLEKVIDFFNFDIILKKCFYKIF